MAISVTTIETVTDFSLSAARTAAARHLGTFHDFHCGEYQAEFAFAMVFTIETRSGSYLMTFTATSPDGNSLMDTQRPEIVTISSGKRGRGRSMVADAADTSGAAE